jgi:hypothetical protein
MPEAAPTECLGWVAEHGPRARIGIRNAIGLIENKEGAWKRLKYRKEHVILASRNTLGLLGI